MDKITYYQNFINEAEDFEVEGKSKFVKGEKKLMRLFISDRLLKILQSMMKTGDFQSKTAANRIIEFSKGDGLVDFSFLDIDDNKDDFLTFMPANRCWYIMKYENQEEANKEPGLDNQLWKASGRQSMKVGSLLGRLYDDLSDLAVERFVNTYKAEISSILIFNRFKLIKGDEIRKWYGVKSYFSDKGTLGSSCMRYDQCQNFFGLYENNPDKCSLLILTNKDDKLIGRALVWTNLRKPTDKTFMDRIYTIEQSDVELFKKYANIQGWIYKYGQEAHDASYVENGHRINKSISVQLKAVSYPKYPYMDTLKFYNPGTGRLASDAGNPVEGHKRIRLEKPDGSYERVD